MTAGERNARKGNYRRADRMMMELHITTFLIVCPMVFLAGFVDSIGGGGGLISLPAYLIAGLPVHNAIATNKMSSSMGTCIAAIQYCRKTVFQWKLTIPMVMLSLLGSAIGSRLSLMVSEDILKMIMLVLLPAAAFLVLRKNMFLEERQNGVSEKRILVIGLCAAFVIGCYDGFYGPGTGTFLMIVFIGIAHMKPLEAAANTKILNLSSNVAALLTFLTARQVLIPLGLAAAAFSIAGNYLGTAMVMKNGTKVIRPIILIVLVLLFIKVLGGF